MITFSDMLSGFEVGDADRPLLSSSQGALNAVQVRQRISDLRACLDAMAAAPGLASRLDNGLDAALLDLTLRQLDAVHVPVPSFFSPEQFAHALNHSGVNWLALPLQHEPGSAWQRQRLPGWANFALWRRRLPSAPRWHPGSAVVTYTSGTTDRPKGVCLSAHSLLRTAAAMNAATAGLSLRRHLCALPLSTLLENVALYAALLRGAEVVLPTLGELGYSGAAGLDPQRFAATVEALVPDSLILVPQLLQGLLDALERGGRGLSGPRFIAVGGARVPDVLIQRALACGLPVYQGYGLSECGSVVALNRPGDVRDGSVGRALPHVELRVDAQGELHVRGTTMLGYLGMPPLAADEVSTGDRVRLDDEGYLYIEGRLRNVFITAFGRNVAPEWIEAELCASPLIAQAVVEGEGRPWNTAVLVPRRAMTDPTELNAEIARINAGLPDYARIGDWLTADHAFTTESGLLTANGRVRRAAVLQRYAQAIEARYRTPDATLRFRTTGEITA